MFLSASAYVHIKLPVKSLIHFCSFLLHETFMLLICFSPQWSSLLLSILLLWEIQRILVHIPKLILYLNRYKMSYLWWFAFISWQFYTVFMHLSKQKVHTKCEKVLKLLTLCLRCHWFVSPTTMKMDTIVKYIVLYRWILLSGINNCQKGSDLPIHLPVKWACGYFGIFTMSFLCKDKKHSKVIAQLITQTDGKA